MRQGLITEAEWRLSKQRRHPAWIGAQCFYPRGIGRWGKNRDLKRGMIAASIMISAAFLSISFENAAPVINLYQTELPTVTSVRSLRAVTYQLPEEFKCQSYTFTRAQLLRGQMLLLDDLHILPHDTLPPNTVSIAHYGSGMVPVRSLSVRSGYDTIDALKELFSQLRTKNVDGIYVSQGIMSCMQQKKAMLERCRKEMRVSPPDEAVIAAKRALAWPGTGSLVSEYTIEIKQTNGLPLRETEQGQQFLQLCWRYGFVCESQKNPTRFRFVGKAHAAAITYLDLELESYLKWLQEKQVITISSGGRPQYVICSRKMQGDYAVFDLPVEAAYEMSLDNMGYAVVACTLKNP